MLICQHLFHIIYRIVRSLPSQPGARPIIRSPKQNLFPGHSSGMDFSAENDAAQSKQHRKHKQDN